MTKNRLTFGALLAAAIGVGLLGCQSDSAGEAGAAGGEPGTGGQGGASAPNVLVTSGYVADAFSFYYPEGLDSEIPGFDLDARTSSAEAPGESECAHDDFMSPTGEPGIDYNFLKIIFTEEVGEDGEFLFGGFREGQIVDGVINGAVKNGSMTMLIDIQGVDDPLNDDEVTVQIFGSEDSPMKGTDDEVLPHATLSVHPDSSYHTGEVTGSIVDGVLTAGPLDLIFPIEIQIVSDEFIVHDSWVRITFDEDRMEGILGGFWDVNNIRDIIGKPTTDNGNAANFNIEQFEAAMLEFADGDFDPAKGICTSFTTMFRFRGVQAFIARGGGGAGEGGTGGGGGPVNQPTDQCIGPDDTAVLEEIGGLGPVGELAASCPQLDCGRELTDVLTGGGDAAGFALGDCIAQCITDGTGLSRDCTDCYGSIAACSTQFCVGPCAADPSSAECTDCALENCPDLGVCTGL